MAITFKQAALVAIVAIAAVACTLPPQSNIIYHYYSNFWPPAAAQKIVGLVQGVVASSAINAALKLGLFEYLNKQPQSVEVVARDLRLDTRGTRIFLNSLVSFDLLEVHGEKYHLTGASKKHLLKDGDEYLGFFVTLMHGILDRWDELDRAVKLGGSARNDTGDGTFDHDFWHVFAVATREAARHTAKIIAGNLAPLAAANPKLRVLDIAAGSGSYGHTIAATFPDAHVTLLDYPKVLEQTQENRRLLFPSIESTRVKYLPGDFFNMDVGGPYDVIVASQFYHHFDKKKNIELSRIIHKALKPGGVVLIHDFVSSTKPQPYEFGSFFSLVMLQWTHKGEAFNYGDYQEILSAAAFTNIRHVSMFPQPSSIVMADRAK